MKKFTLFIVLLSAYSVSYSQDLKNDSLPNESKIYKDSVENLLKANKKIISELTGKIDSLQKDTAKLKDRVKKLDKKNLEELEKSLQQKADSIKNLKDTIHKKDSLQIATGIESRKKENAKFEEGKQNVYDQIRQTYQSNTIDYLIQYSTRQSVERDLMLVGDKEAAGQKLKDLQAYFAALQTLSEKYDEQNVTNFQTRLNCIMQKSDALESLKNRLSNYKICSNGLKNTIDSIVTYDKHFTGNSEAMQKTKLQDILTWLSSYFRNYHFNFTDYPFLADIVLEVMKLKQKDVDTDISGLLSKL